MEAALRWQKGQLLPQTTGQRRALMSEVFVSDSRPGPGPEGEAGPRASCFTGGWAAGSLVGRVRARACAEPGAHVGEACA